MYCVSCGNRLDETARFCPVCGAPNQSAFRSDAERRTGAEAPVPAEAEHTDGAPVPSVTAPPPSYDAIPAGNKMSSSAQTGIVIGAVAAAVIILGIIVSIILGIGAGSHDLSGTYTYDGRFPITTITFSTDGTFTARCDYYEYSTSALYYGKYHKEGDVYRITFTGAKSSSGNAVTDFSNQNFGYSFEMSAQKVGKNALTIWVSGGNNYYAWMNTTATFYR